MTKVDTLIKEIDSLQTSELELLLTEIIRRIKKAENVKQLLTKYCGIGKGLWQQDAQTYINSLREDATR